MPKRNPEPVDTGSIREREAKMKFWSTGFLIAAVCTFSLAGCKTTRLSLNEIKSATTRPGGMKRLAEKKAKQAACNESCQAAYKLCFDKCSESAETSAGDHLCGQGCNEARSLCLNDCRSALN